MLLEHLLPKKGIDQNFLRHMTTVLDMCFILLAAPVLRLEELLITSRELEDMMIYHSLLLK